MTDKGSGNTFLRVVRDTGNHQNSKLSECIEPRYQKERNVGVLASKNIKYIFTWIIYYAWCVVFTTWWTSSPMTDATFGVGSRTLLHSLYLISSAIVIFIMKQKSFKKYATRGAIAILVTAVLFAVTQNGIFVASVFHIA